MRVITQFTDEYEFLSNFYRLDGGLEFRGLEVPTSEHAYQAMKATERDAQQWIADAPSPSKAKKRGRKVELRPHWSEVKTRIMERVLRRKFQRPNLREKLEATYPAVLVECNSWGDRFWGVCDGEGRNKLGRLLMHIRNEPTRIRNE